MAAYVATPTARGKASGRDRFDKDAPFSRPDLEVEVAHGSV
jgi:hypothetical protein